MKSLLTNPVKERVIRELKAILYNHPKYREDSERVQNKFSFKERPQRGIIVTDASAERVRLSSDNYVGSLSSFCMLTWANERLNSNSIEWVRENFPLMETFSRNRTVFPSPAGVYTVTVTRVPDVSRKIPGQFTVTPVLDEQDEQLITFQDTMDTSAQLTRENVFPGSLRLWLDSRTLLIPDVDYSVDYETGAIIFLRAVPVHRSILANYRYKSPATGPYDFWNESTNVDAIPGVVMAFGDRVEIGTEQMVVVTNQRQDVAQVYGGKFELNFSLTLFTRDSEDREKMSDYVVVEFLRLQNNLAFEGLELLDISPNGESEDVYDSTDGSYFYETSLALSIRSDWEIQIPLPITIQRAEQHTRTEELTHGHLDGTYVDDLVQIRTLSGQNIAIRASNVLTYERIS